MKLIQSLADGRTAWLWAIDGFVLYFLAVGVVPTFNFCAFFFMFLKITKFDDFIALDIGTPDVKI